MCSKSSGTSLGGKSNSPSHCRSRRSRKELDGLLAGIMEDLGEARIPATSSGNKASAATKTLPTMSPVASLPSRSELRTIERHGSDQSFSPKRGAYLRRSSSMPGSIAVQQSGPVHRPMLQRSFGISDRQFSFALQTGSSDDMGPGYYDTHKVGTLVWDRDQDVSHPGQKQLSNHRSPVLASFGKPKKESLAGGPPLRRLPGPGHYDLPDLWDASWQQNPPRGKSFVRNPPPPGESRFGGLARGLA